MENTKPTSRDELIESVGTKRSKLTNAEANLVQKPFLVALKKRMDEDGLTPAKLAEKLRIPYSYIVALTSGMRLIGNAERSKVELFADYLGVPVVQIYIWGGLLNPKDFVVRLRLNKTLDNIFQIMQQDPLLTTIMPASDDWNNKREFSDKSKLMIAQLYELLTQRMLIERANLGPGKTKDVIKRD